MKQIYEKHYKALLIIPFAILLLAMAQIAYQTSTTGDFVNRGVSLKGGISIAFAEKSVDDLDSLKNSLQDAIPEADLNVIRVGDGVTIEAADVPGSPDEQEDALIKALTPHLGPITKADYAPSVTSDSLGSSFFKQTFFAVGLAFFFMGIAVLITFRKWAPSAAVMLAAFSDIVVTLAIFNISGMRLSDAGIAAFLMLIGYSVDTDILLCTRVFKRHEGSVIERVYSAMKTGFTMNFTTLAAVLTALFVTQSDKIQQIMIILLIGLLVDMINTWIQNAGIVRWYLEARK